MRLTEAHVDSLRNFLRANLGAGIDQMNATVTDGLLLVKPKAENIVHGGATILEYPSIEIAVPDFELHDMSVENVEMDMTANIVIRGWLELADLTPQAPEKIYRLAQRMAQVILALILPAGNNAFADQTIITRVRGSFRLNPETQQKEEYVSGFILICTLETVDAA